VTEIFGLYYLIIAGLCFYMNCVSIFCLGWRGVSGFATLGNFHLRRAAIKDQQENGALVNISKQDVDTGETRGKLVNFLFVTVSRLL